MHAVGFPGYTRKLNDLPRSGAVEAVAGEVNPAALNGKMADTNDQNKESQGTYLPWSAWLTTPDPSVGGGCAKRIRAES